ADGRQAPGAGCRDGDAVECRGAAAGSACLADAHLGAESRRPSQGFQRGVRGMTWLTSRRAADPADTDCVDETACEPVQPVVEDDGSEDIERFTDADESDHDDRSRSAGSGIQWSKAIAYGLIPGLVFLLASAAGYLKWQ